MKDSAILHAVGTFLLAVILLIMARIIGIVEARTGTLAWLPADLINIAGWVIMFISMAFVVAIALEWTAEGVTGKPPR